MKAGIPAQLRENEPQPSGHEADSDNSGEERRQEEIASKAVPQMARPR